MAEAGLAPSEPIERLSSRRYQAYVLFVLCLIFAFNFGDRMLIGTLQEPLRAEFNLSDFQLGLLGGPAFALLYTVAGFPLARWADRGNRVTIISLALGTWSLMTALCGAAGSFLHLFLARVGVSIGEAGCSPPAHSLISEYFPRERRSTAMAIYATGAPIGMMATAIIGGYVAQHYGWRITMVGFGVAGVFVAVLAMLTVWEPRRGATERPPLIGFGIAIRTLLSKRTLIHTCLGAAICSIASNFLTQYMTSFLMRSHGLELAQAALIAGAGGSGGAALGTFGSGLLADRLSRRRLGATAYVPAVGISLAACTFWIVFSSPSIAVVVPTLLIAVALLNTYMGQSYALVQSVSPSTMRATAAALFICANSLLGYGLGPPLFGLLSDTLASSSMAQNGLDLATCRANLALPNCAIAQATGLRWSLIASTPLLFWAAIHFVLAGRALKRDLVG